MNDETASKDRHARLTAALMALRAKAKASEPDLSDLAELSAAERRMWFLSALDPESRAYVIVSARRIHGQLEVEMLQRAVDWLVQRHEALRTSYEGAQYAPRRVVHSSAFVPVQFEDLREGLTSHGDSRLEERISELAREPFDLAKPNLARFYLLQCPEDQVLLVFLHHIIADGWSLSLLYRELGQALNALRETGELPDSAAAPSYAEAVRRQDSLDSIADQQAGIDWWKERLCDLPVLELPTDHPRPPVPSFQGTRHIVMLPPAATARLESLAREHSTTVFTVSLAAFVTLLRAQTRNNDLVIGTPVANRRTTISERALGLFVNTLVLRFDLSGRHSVREIIDVCNRTVLDALARQTIPFETLVDALQPQRTLSHNPLFQIMFAMHEATSIEPAVHGLEVTAFDPDTGTCRFDLEFTIWRQSDSLRIRVTASSDLFEPDTVRQLAEQYHEVLEMFANDPDTPLESGRLGVKEREWLAYISRNQLKDPDLSLPVHELFLKQVKQNRDRIALKTVSREWSYQQLDEASAGLASHLMTQGVRSGDLVAVCCERESFLVVAILAIWRAGAAVVPLAVTDPQDRRDFILRDSGVSVVITEFERHAWVQALGLVAVAPNASMLPNTEPVEVQPDNLAYVIYTSGTTGQPKGVLVSHRNVSNTLVGCRSQYGINHEARFLVLAPQNFDIFYFELMTPLISGGTAILVTRDELFNPAAIIGLMRQSTAMQAVSRFLQRLIETLEQAGEKCPGMRHVFTGGEAVPTTLPERAQAAFPSATVTSLYGPTETAMVCTGFTFPREGTSLSSTIGRPLPNVVVRVCDPDLNLVMRGVPGELLIGGAGVSRGYLGQDELTSRRFVELDGERFYRSGDRVRWNTRGQLEFLGRLDDQVKIRGFRVEPGEIQAVLESHPEIEVATVTTDNNDSEEVRLTAYFVRRKGGEARPAIFAGESKHQNSWMTLFDDIHERAADTDERDFTGWVSAFSGERLPRSEMDDWLEGTLRQIHEISRHLPKREGGQRVLEIGCGTGLLVNELARANSEYIACDFSEAVLERIKSRLGNRLSNVRLVLCAAHEVLEKVDGDFDLVILNSVAQYFPSAGYLARVLENVAKRVRTGGAIFVGDVRSLPLLEAYHYARAVQQDPDEVSDGLKQLARQRVESEEELVLSPGFYGAITERSNLFQSWEARPRRGLVGNELSRFRFDAVLHRRASNERLLPNWVPWRLFGSEQAIKNALASLDGGALAISGIPDERLRGDPAVVEWLGEMPGARGVHPETLHSLAEKCGLCAWVSCANMKGGLLDVLFAPPDHDLSLTTWPQANDPGPLSNIPLGFTSDLSIQLEEYARQRLPAYMLPSSFVELEWLPLTPNGKVDAQALPTVPRGYASRGQTHRPPRPGVESLIADVWKQSLHLPVVYANDGFFDIGGNSLLAIEVAVRLRAHKLAISPQDLFRHQTIEELGRNVESLPDPNLTVSTPVIDSRPPPGSPVEKSEQDLVQRPSQAGVADCLLLTGATGFLGAHILRALLLKPSPAKILCLVRRKDDQSPIDRLREVMKWYFGDLPAGFHQRVRLISSDLTAPRLGMSADDWSAAAAADQIVHVAADVRHVGQAEEIYSVNQQGTVQLLELAADLLSSRFHLVSTIGVKGIGTRDERQNFYEHDLDVGQSWTEDYSKSKFAAEVAVRNYAQRGGATKIYRVGTIGPQWETGRFQRRIGDHFFTRFLRSTILLGIAADWPGRTFGLNPVDHLAEAIVALIRDQSTPVGSVFHLDTPHRLSHYNLIQILHAYGYAIRVVSPESYERCVLQLVEHLGEVEAGGVFSLLRPPERQSLKIESSWSLAQLATLGFTFQPMDESRFVRFLEHCVERGFLPPPIHRGIIFETAPVWKRSS